MYAKYINSAILAVLVVGVLYIAYQYEQDYKWTSFMTCIEQTQNPSEYGTNEICNTVIFRSTSVYSPLRPQHN